MIRARLVLTLLTTTASGVSFLAYTWLLRALGASTSVDSLFSAASVPTASAAVTSGVILYILPPQFVRMTHEAQCACFRGLLAIAAVCTVGMSIAFSALAWGIGSSGTTMAMLCGFWLFGGASVGVTVGVCIAQARGHVVSSGVAPSILSLGLAAGVGFAAETSDVEWVMVGQLVGGLAGLAWLTVQLDCRRDSFRSDMRATASLGRAFRGNVHSILLGTLAFTLFQPIDAALCRLLEPGALTVMSYAQRVLVAVGTAASLGAYAVAARSAHDAITSGGGRAVWRSAARESGRLIAFGVLAWLAFIFFGKQVLALVLGASSMSVAEIARTESCLAIMLFAVGPMAAVPYLFRMFYAMNAYRYPAIIGAGVGLVYASGSYALLARFGLEAMQYTYVVVWWLACFASLFLLRQVAFRQEAGEP